MRVVRATSEKAAARAAAEYCAKYMHAYPGVTFEYSKNEMKEYKVKVKQNKKAIVKEVLIKPKIQKIKLFQKETNLLKG